MLAPQKKSYHQPWQHIKKQRYYFADKGPSSQSYGFSSGRVWMLELDHKENWALKNWCFWTVVLEKTLESPLDCTEIKPVNPKGNQSQYSLDELMLKLKLQYVGHLMQRTDSVEIPWFGVSASASVLPMNIQDWFPLGLVGLISMQSKGLSRVFSNTTVQKHQFFSAQFSL